VRNEYQRSYSPGIRESWQPFTFRQKAQMPPAYDSEHQLLGTGAFVVLSGGGAFVVLSGTGAFVVLSGGSAFVVLSGAGVLGVLSGAGTFVVLRYGILPCRALGFSGFFTAGDIPSPF
jgi:hypothetical protein